MISNNTIVWNDATDSGGGIYCDTTSSPAINNNTIDGNSAVNYGGGICLYTSASTVADNNLSYNSAAYGGSVYCDHSDSAVIVNNTMVGNTATDDGGAIYTDYSAATIANNIIWHNTSGLFKNYGINQPTLRNNCVYGNTSYDSSSNLAPGIGDISADPKLASINYSDLHIQPNSPCRYVGWSGAPGIGSLDIDGQARLQLLTGTIDIGADESDGTTWTPAPRIVYVTSAGLDTNDGSTWAKAKLTIQAAIDSVWYGGAEIWVAPGPSPQQYNENIILRPCVYVYGGFAGSETSRTARDWNTHVTTISGQWLGSTVTMNAGYTWSAIDGFNIADGKSGLGAGICCSFNASPSIANNYIYNNSANNGLPSCGGGVACVDAASPNIVNNRFAYNSASVSGGAIYCDDQACPVICGNVIGALISNGTAYAEPNTAGNTGGGIFCGSNSAPFISNNKITYNQALFGAGIGWNSSASSIIYRNWINHNTANTYGGGLYLNYRQTERERQPGRE